MFVFRGPFPERFPVPGSKAGWNRIEWARTFREQALQALQFGDSVVGRVLFVACTPVARWMISEILTRPDLASVEIAGVVNLSPTAAIGKANYDSYTDLIREYAIPHYYCQDVNEAGCVQFVTVQEPDLIIQSGWSQKFRPEIMAIPRYGCIGEHPAPLPRGRGAACVNWAILTGETEWGDSFFRMEERYDTGVVYAQRFFSIEPHDDVKTVYDRVARCSAEIVREHIVDWVAGRLHGLPQDDSKATYYKRRRPSDGLFDFSRPAMDVYNAIRAQARPYPGAFFMATSGRATGRKVMVWRAAYGGAAENPDAEHMAPGDDGSLSVVCGDGCVVRLIRVQVENMPEIWGAELVR